MSSWDRAWTGRLCVSDPGVPRPCCGSGAGRKERTTIACAIHQPSLSQPRLLRHPPISEVPLPVLVPLPLDRFPSLPRLVALRLLPTTHAQLSARPMKPGTTVDFAVESVPSTPLGEDPPANHHTTVPLPASGQLGLAARLRNATAAVHEEVQQP